MRYPFANNETAVQVHILYGPVPNPPDNPQLLYEAGNHSRSAAPRSIVGHTYPVKQLMFTGWHKNTPPNSTEP